MTPFCVIDLDNGLLLLEFRFTFCAEFSSWMTYSCPGNDCLGVEIATFALIRIVGVWGLLWQLCLVVKFVGFRVWVGAKWTGAGLIRSTLYFYSFGDMCVGILSLAGRRRADARTTCWFCPRRPSTHGRYWALR